MAHKVAGGSSKLGRDSQSKRLGVKKFGGQIVRAGQIIVRQRGTKFAIGDGVFAGKDYTIHAKADGAVKFSHKMKRLFSGKLKKKTFVNVVSSDKNGMN